MQTINLRDFYPWHTEDEFIEMPDEIAAELQADKRYQNNHERSMRRNKVYSLDADDGTSEAAAIACHGDDPHAVMEMKERHCRLCHALNSLPEIQGRRVEAHFLLGKSRKEIAEAEGVRESSVNESIDRGIKAMRKAFSQNIQGCPVKRP